MRTGLARGISNVIESGILTWHTILGRYRPHVVERTAPVPKIQTFLDDEGKDNVCRNQYDDDVAG